ncbi:MAG: DNA-3-methyladenine glycosylase 2 family protein, partial [Mycobacteriales bacterium]
MTRSAETLGSERTWVPGGRLDVVGTMSPLQRGGADPCHRVAAGSVWRTFPAPTGPATLRLITTGGAVHA